MQGCKTACVRLWQNKTACIGSCSVTDNPDRGFSSIIFCRRLSSPFCRRPSGTFCRRPSGTFCRRPSGTFCRRPSGTVCRRPSGTFCRRPSGTFCRRPSSAFCRRPSSAFCRRPSGAFCRRPSSAWRNTFTYYDKNQSKTCIFEVVFIMLLHVWLPYVHFMSILLSLYN